MFFASQNKRIFGLKFYWINRYRSTMAMAFNWYVSCEDTENPCDNFKGGGHWPCLGGPRLSRRSHAECSMKQKTNINSSIYWWLIDPTIEIRSEAGIIQCTQKWIGIKWFFQIPRRSQIILLLVDISQIIWQVHADDIHAYFTGVNKDYPGGIYQILFIVNM